MTCMNAAHPSPIRLRIVNRSSQNQRIHISPWGTEIALGEHGGIALEQPVPEAGYFEIDVRDTGIYLHAWPTVPAAVSTADGTVSLDPEKIAPQHTTGRATGWPGDSREFATQRNQAHVAGFFIDDSRPSATLLRIATDDTEYDHDTDHRTWITAVSATNSPALEVHDEHLVVSASTATWVAEDHEREGWVPIAPDGGSR